MTDRELLELTAKAAGIKGRYQSNGLEGWSGICLMDCTGNFQTQVWNPLTDDGDALRLSVELGLEIFPAHAGRGGNRLAMVNNPHNDFHVTEMVRKEDDPYAATRRAIVRAAAEIGKNI